MIHSARNAAASSRKFFMSALQSAGELELAELIVAAVNLEGVAPADIDPEAPLFGDGLGLDSIDALEIALEISKRYGVQLRADDEENRRIFARCGRWPRISRSSGLSGWSDLEHPATPRNPAACDHGLDGQFRSLGRARRESRGAALAAHRVDPQ